MIVNGESFELDQPLPLIELLTKRGYDPALVAVLLNDKVAPKGSLGQITVLNDDVLEVVSFVGGG
ncbi:MAG: sulfur carrier protein ThiS [Deltaproteobacteria bacterium]|nr:sulfur carrier protein ThiS [Deltaproteobacteria bacterium]